MACTKGARSATVHFKLIGFGTKFPATWIDSVQFLKKSANFILWLASAMHSHDRSINLWELFCQCNFLVQSMGDKIDFLIANDGWIESCTLRLKFEGNWEEFFRVNWRCFSSWFLWSFTLIKVEVLEFINLQKFLGWIRQFFF